MSIMTSRINLNEYLQRIGPYSALTPDQRQQLIEGARFLEEDKGQVLFEHGERASHVYVVICGHVKLGFSSQQGAEKVVSVSGPGESFGEACVTLGRDYPFRAEMLEAATLLVIPAPLFHQLMADNAAFAALVTRRIAENLHYLLQEMESASLMSGAERVADFLVRQLDRDAAGAVTVDLALPKSVIASRLSLTQEHFSRLLRQLSDQGLIEVDRRHVHIPNVGQLRRFLNSGAGHCVNRGGRSFGRGRTGWGQLAAA